MVDFPSAVPAVAEDLIRRLCHAVPKKRLPEAKGYAAGRKPWFPNLVL